MRICEAKGCDRVINLDSKRATCTQCRRKRVNDVIYYCWAKKEWPNKTFTMPGPIELKSEEEKENDRQRIARGEYNAAPTDRPRKRGRITIHGKPRKKRKPSKYFPDRTADNDSGKSETSG